jgi:FtsP/CotA-like multicopper oxidase with cupredoxin domain
MKNKHLLLSMFLFVLILTCNQNNYLSGDSSQISSSENYLLIPPLLKNKSKNKNIAEFELVAQQGVTQFYKGKLVATYGYNGNLLGPTIRAKRGQIVKIKVTNNLREYTTVHWHGMLLPSEMDGGPHQVIRPNGVWKVKFKVNQPAATLWYHPHGLGTTGLQVYRGLAGLFILDDNVSEKLNIPKKYGYNDIPLIIQDKRFSSDGMPVYISSMLDIVEGFKGNTALVNGTVKPVLYIDAIKIRFRVLNGSNARVYNLRFDSDKPFYQIATDGSFLEKPVKLTKLRLSPGERAELIVDFSKHELNEKIFLKDRDYKIIKFVINKKPKDYTVLPKNLFKIKRYNLSDSQRTRYFNLSGFGHMVNINGKRMNMNRVDEYVKYKNIEIWKVKSDMSTHGMMGMMGRMRGFQDRVKHNFHAHGVQFLIMKRNNSLPPLNERAWKDTFFVAKDETVSVITRFLYKGLFMYHCHILEHEDNGMMGQFLVE